MLYFNQKALGIDGINTKSIHRYLDGIRVGCKMILQLAVERRFHVAVIAILDRSGQDELRTLHFSMSADRLLVGILDPAVVDGS